MQNTVEHTTQTFKAISDAAMRLLHCAGFVPVQEGGKFHVTAPWHWHRHGDHWQFWIHDGEQHIVHFIEDENGTLHHD